MRAEAIDQRSVIHRRKVAFTRARGNISSYPMARAPRPWLCALLAVAACRGGGRDRAARPDSSGPTIDASTPWGQVALGLWQLQGGVTLTSWLVARGDEQVERYGRALGRDHLASWCARAARIDVAGGRPVERAAFFYPPPATFALPSDSASADSLVGGCVLGLIGTTIAVRDSAEGARTADSVRAELSRIYGPGRDGAGVRFFASAFWSRVRVWERSGRTVVAALNGPPAQPADSASRWTVLAFAFVPASGLSIAPPAGAGDPSPEAGLLDTLPLERAAALARVDSTLWLALRRALLAGTTPARADALRPRTPPADSLGRALRRWLQATQDLEPPRRAAALFVADAVLDRAMCGYGLCAGRDSAAQRPLRALGAEFNWSPLGAGWVYTRTWLYEARALDRDSPVGQAILLQQLAQAFDPSGTCAEGTEGFVKVMETGERYLARVPASPIAPAVHYFLGEAYRDVVALAAGAGAPYADSTEYVADAAHARASALAHYRAAAAGAPGTPLGIRAWQRAWWLLSGLEPRDVRFYCVYD